MLTDRDQCDSALAFREAVLAMDSDKLPFEIPCECDEMKWFAELDAAIFHSSEWDEESIPADLRKQGKATLAKIHERIGQPSRYFAVLAMDGDSMGQWVSGAKSPTWKMQIAEETRREFFDNPEIPGHELRKALLEAPRHVSPSYHLQLSEALGNFSVYLARPIVESFDGRLIYSGGDDVLAMLPAEQALDCARALRKAFRGDVGLKGDFAGVLDSHESHAGFVALDGSHPMYRNVRRFLPRGVPLIVPGPRADISAGIAFAHMHAPLQNVVEAAHKALDRAKARDGKAAFAVSLFKRSGEILEWSAKWESRAIAVADQFQKASAMKDGLSAKFPYALATLLRPYMRSSRPSAWKISTIENFDPFTVFPLEVAHVTRRQSSKTWHDSNGKDFADLVCEFLGQDCQDRPLDDFLGPFLTTAFIHRTRD
jgi:hypothetical protein